MSKKRSRTYVVAECAECKKDFPLLEPNDDTCSACRFAEIDGIIGPEYNGSTMQNVKDIVDLLEEAEDQLASQAKECTAAIEAKEKASSAISRTGARSRRGRSTGKK